MSEKTESEVAEAILRYTLDNSEVFLMQEVERLEAERDRYKKALAHIRELVDEWFDDNIDDEKAMQGIYIAEKNSRTSRSTKANIKGER